jgi:hypothetical protein
MRTYCAIIQTLILGCLAYLVIFFLHDGVRKGVESGLAFHEAKKELAQMEAVLGKKMGTPNP